MTAIQAARRVVLLHEHGTERYGHVMDEAVLAYASGFEANGYRTEIIDCSDFSNACGRIAALGRDPSVAAFFNAGGKGLLNDVHDTRSARPDTGDKPVIVQHGDHPYHWIRHIVRIDFPTKITFFNDPASVDLITRLGLGSGRTFYSPPCIFGADEVVEHRERDIPLIFVGLIGDPADARLRFVRARPENARELDAVYESAVDNFQRPLFDIAQEVLLDLGSELDLLSARGQSLLDCCDWAIRHRRRRRMLFRVKRHPVLVVAQSHVGWKGMHQDTRSIPGLPLREVLQLCSRAKAMLLPQPTYPNGLTERILYAMDRGMAVVASPSPALGRYFRVGQDLLTVREDHTDIDERIDDALDERVRAPMSESARAAVRRQFMPRQIIASHIARAAAAGLPL